MGIYRILEIIFVITAVARGTVAADCGITKKLVGAVCAVFIILLYVLCAVSRLVLIILLYVDRLIVLSAVLRGFLVIHMSYLPFYKVSMLIC